VVFHLLEEVRRRAAGVEDAGGRSRSDGAQSFPLAGVVMLPAQISQEPAFQEVRVGRNLPGELLQVHPQLFA